MPKVKSLRKHTRTEAHHPYKVNTDNSEDVTAFGREQQKASESDKDVDKNGFTLSRGQRRRAEKNERVQIKLGKAPVVNLAQQKQLMKKVEESPKVTQMLSEFEESLRAHVENSEDIKPAANVVTSNKMKHQIAVREAARMKIIQKHPVFLQDPLAAMKAHLEQMVELRQASKNSK